MSNDYYASPTDLAPGTKARAGDINTIDQSVDAAFNKLPSELALKSGTVNYAVNKSATANAYAVDLPAAVQAYIDGLEVKMRPGSDNTGAATLNVNGLGAIAIKRQDGADAQAGDLVGTSPITLIYSSASNSFRMPPLANAQVTQAAASAQASATSAAASAASAGAASGSAQAAATARTAADQAAYNSGQSASASATSAGQASTSAGQAAGSAQSAATSASNLAGAVTSASGSAQAASNSAGAASGSATAADTSAKASDTSAKASAASAKASSDSASASATSAGQAQTYANLAAGSATAAANTASQLQTSVTTSANTAVSSAQQAGAARDAAIAAWQASTAPTEQLAAISKQLHQGSIVDVFLYDTSKDSDGGAWRKRCKHTSWENEPLVSGKWLGLQANLAAAQAAGGITGDYYQSGVDGRFYGIGTGEQFRGNTREFPALALMVLETKRLVIYDATQPGVPMWMVFNSADWTRGIPIVGDPAQSTTSVVATNGYVWVSHKGAISGTIYGGIVRVSFVADSPQIIAGGSWNYTFRMNTNIANRNTGSVTNAATGGGGVLSNSEVNDLSVAVLPDAPIDLATGLPIPTIAAGTAGGINVLKHDGTVINSGSGAPMDGVRFTERYTIQFNYYGHCSETVPITTATNGFGSSMALVGAATGFSSGSNTIDNPLGYSAGNAKDAISGGNGLTRVKRGNTAARTMVAAITNAYNSGYQVGDSRGAWLADTVAETLAGQAEAVTNGTFNSNIAGWTASDLSGTGAANISFNAGRLRIANSIANYGSAYQKLTLVPGKTYTASVDYFLIAGGYAAFRLGTSPSTYDVHGGTDSIAAPNKGVITFVAPQAEVYLILFVSSGAGSISEFDNVSVQPAIVQNGTFENYTTSWISSNGGQLSCVSGKLRVAATTPYGGAVQNIPTIPGKAYVLTFDAGTFTNATSITAVARWGGNLGAMGVGPNTKNTLYFIASSTSVDILFEAQNQSAAVFDLDNISVKLADSDRSVKGKSLNVYGSITKAPVAAGAQLVGYSGFSAANYLEQPYNSDLDFGTGDFCIMGWAIPVAAGDQTLFFRATGNSSATPANGINMWMYGAGNLVATQIDGVGLSTPTNTLTPGAPHLIELSRQSGTVSLYVNGVLKNNAAIGSSLTLANSFVRIGSGFYVDTGHKLALWRVSATVPSADQRAQIYRDELPLFQPGAQCTVDGTALSIYALTYDDSTDLLHVGTAWGRSAFKGLQRVESSATVVGAVTALAAGRGAHITGGSTGARFSQPAQLLRDELVRKDEERRVQGRIPVPHWFTGTGALASFTLPIGFEPYAVYLQGLLMREGSSNDYTTSFDGYRWTVTFPANVANTYNICIMGVRNGAN